MPLKNNPELGPAKVPVHRITCVLNFDAGNAKFPLQDYREAHDMLLSLKAADSDRALESQKETDGVPALPDDPNQLGGDTGTDSEAEKIDEALDW